MALSDAEPFAVAAWTLDEESGTRVDQVGSNDLTDNNTVGFAAGKFGNAAEFERANSEHLSITDNAALSMGDVKVTFRAWVQLESKAAGNMVVVAKDTTGNGEYYLYYAPGTDRWTFAAYGASSFGSGTVLSANNAGSPNTGVFYLIHAWHDPDTNEIGISVNAGTADTAAHSAGILDQNGVFRIGNDAFNDLFDGLIDDPVVLKGYILDATERTEDYNSGTGVAFADWAGGGGTAITPATETDTAVTLAATKSRTPSPSTETDSAVTVDRVKSRTPSPAAETDTAVGLTRVKSRALGVATETDTAIGLSREKSRTLGVATETDTAVSLTSAGGTAITPATETDTAVGLSRVKSRTLGVAVETDAAVGLSEAADAGGITEDLVSHWKLDEASGNALDAHGSNELSDVNTVGAGTGKINGARDFEDANSERFERADGDFAGFPTAAMSISCWLTPETLGANKLIAAKWNHGTSSTFILQANSDGSVRCFIAPTATDLGTVRADTPAGVLANGVDAHLVLVFDGSGATNADRLKIYIDGVEQTLSFTGTIPAALVDSTAAFQMGGMTSLSRHWDGLIDEFSLWGRAITSGQVTRINNGNDGLPYPWPITAGITPATETDTAVGLARVKSRTLSPATETNSPFSLFATKSRSLGVAMETDVAVGLTEPVPIPDLICVSNITASKPSVTFAASKPAVAITASKPTVTITKQEC